MSRPSDESQNLESLREKIIGLGDRSFRKSYYPQLRQQLWDLQRFRALLDQSSDAVFLLEAPSGRLVDVNESACRQLLIPRGKLLNLTLNDIAGPLPAYAADLLRLRGPAPSEPVIMETVLIKGNGDRFPVEITLRLVSFGGKFYAVGAARDITERRRSEEQLRLSEQKYRSLFSSIEEGFVICEPAVDQAGRLAGFRLLEANPAFEKLMGAAPGLTAGRNMRELIPSLEDLWTVICEAAAGTGESIRAVRHVEEIGRWLEIYAFSRDKGTLALLFSDITERKLAEEKTSRLLGQLRAIFDNIPVGIAYLDGDFRFISANKFFCDLCDIREAELIGKPCYETVGEYVAHETRKGLAKICSFCKKEECIRLKKPTVIERPHGELTLRVHTIPEISEEGEITRFLEIVEDITQRKRLEESLREGERRFREITESLPQLIWTTDRKGFCDYLSRQWVEYTGIPAEEQLGARWLQAVHPEDRDRSWELWTRFIRGQVDEYDLEYRLRRADGEYRWFKTRGVPVHDEAGRTIKIFGSCTDIDDKIRAEKALRELGAELQRSNRELEQFAYVVSHDLREPLRTISGFLNLLQGKYRRRLAPEANEYIGYAVDGADRLDRMIRDLLEYSRIQRQEITRRPIPLSRVWLSAAENLHLLIAETGARITCDPLPVVRGDAGQLVRLLQNLVSNAITYCKDRRPEIHIGAAPQGERWLISVQDNGIGIKPEHQARIFQIFQRLHTQQEYPGTGIGLAICQKIVERHGGRIWVESEPGKGSVFFFTLFKGAERPGAAEQEGGETGTDPSRDPGGNR